MRALLDDRHVHHAAASTWLETIATDFHELWPVVI
jgi:hypothetical protein